MAQLYCNSDPNPCTTAFLSSSCGFCDRQCMFGSDNSIIYITMEWIWSNCISRIRCNMCNLSLSFSHYSSMQTFMRQRERTNWIYFIGCSSSSISKQDHAWCGFIKNTGYYILFIMLCSTRDGSKAFISFGICTKAIMAVNAWCHHPPLRLTHSFTLNLNLIVQITGLPGYNLRPCCCWCKEMRSERHKSSADFTEANPP